MLTARRYIWVLTCALAGACQDDGQAIAATNVALSDLQGLASLTTVVARFGIYNNESFMSCVGPGVLTSTGAIEFWSNSKLMQLDGLESLLQLGAVRIEANVAIVDVTALAGGTVAVDGSIEILDNAVLAQCDAKALAAAIKPPGYVGGEDVSQNMGACS